MTNEVKNVPELRFPNFSEEWKKFVFKDQIISIEKGTDLLGSEDNMGIPLIKMGNIKRGYFSFNKLEKLRESETIQEKYYIKKGDFLFNTRNTMELVGKSATWTNKSGKFAFNSNIARLVLKDIDTYFFNYLYNTSKMINKVKSLAVGTTSVAAIYPRDLNHLNYFLPLLAEQEKIGEFFSKLDQQIELEEQKLEKLEEQKKGYMQKIFSQELRFKDENGNEYPEWKERKFSELLSYSSNGVDKKINKNHDIAYMVNYMDVFKKTKLNTKNRDLLMEITATKIQKEKNNLKKGDILFTPSSETREDIAKSTVVFEDLDNTVYSYHLIRLRPLDSNIFSLKYSNYLSEQNFISKQFRRLAQGAQRYTLTKEYFENIKLNLPHIKEQEKIGDFFSKLDEVINKQSQKIDELKLRKQGFLQKMFV